MDKMDDIALVRQFAERGSEPAFAELVGRHINLVYSAALRCTGHAEDAKDVTQSVFILLAQKAGSLGAQTIVAGWLYETTRFASMKFLRGKNRQRVREQEAYMQSTLNETEPDRVWTQIEPLLEEAMTHLNEPERTLLALRFFENKSGAETAAILGIQEWAAHKRLNRAVKKLQSFFLKRGITSTTAVLIGSISANSIQAAPVDSGPVSVIKAALAKGAAGGAATLLAAAKGGAGAKAAGATGMFGAILSPLLVLSGLCANYRLGLDEAHAGEERDLAKTLFRKSLLLALGFSALFAVLLYWVCQRQDDPTLFWGSLIPQFVVIYFLILLILGLASIPSRRRQLAGLLATEFAGNYPPAAFEYRSRLSLFGLPLLHIRIGDRFGLLRRPVKAWIAVGSDFAVGVLFASGGIAIAPVSFGGIAIGLLPFGAVALGLVPIGACSIGVWAFGALAVGWQAFGRFAFAWKLAMGGIAIAHDFSLGEIAHAAQANSEIVKQFVQQHLFPRYAQMLSDHGIWVTLIWVIPVIGQGQMAARARRRREQ